MATNTGLFLKFIISNGLYNKNGLVGASGENVVMINVGMPDGNNLFTNCEVEIDGVRYIGNVGVCCVSSEWTSLAPSIGAGYDDVVLVLVKRYDTAVYRRNGSKFVVCPLVYDENIERRFVELAEDATHGRCKSFMSGMKGIDLIWPLSRLVSERLERKYNEVMDLFYSLRSDWNDTFYVHMFMQFGRSRNKEALENLARRVPLRILSRHRHSIEQMEALLLGAAGLLNVPYPDSYTLLLQTHFKSLKEMYNIVPMTRDVWEFDNMRSTSYPTVRIANMAKLFHDHDMAFDKILACETLDEIRSVFRCGVSEYWHTHCILSKVTKFDTKTTGSDGVDLIIINIVVPMLFAYGKQNGLRDLQDKAVDMLGDIKAESNKLVSPWKDAGCLVDSASASQAYIQISKCYCNEKRCPECLIGIKQVREAF